MYKMNEVYFKEQLEKLLAIDSTTGYFRPIQDYVEREIKALGYEYEETHKGGVMAVLNAGGGNPLLITAHLDDIGLIVRHVNDNGTLRVEKVGGLHPEYALAENVRVITRKGQVITGSVQKVNSSVHVTEDDVAAQALDYAKNMCVVLDENVKNAADVKALGIDTGCMIALDPRTVFVNGYIKSRFLDDKVAAAIVLAGMKAVHDENIKLGREVIMHFGMYEEIGHGTSFIPERVKDLLAIDIACTGPAQNSDEHKVTIFAKDSRFPYHYEMMNELIDAAEKGGIDYVTDIFTPHYGTDGDTSIAAGYDIRHAAIGQGTANSHGYERCHMDGIRNTYALMMEYITLA